MGCSRADFRLPRGFRPAVPSSFDAVRGKVFHFVYHFSVFAMRVAAVLICTLPAENYHAAVLAPQPSVLAWAVVVAAPSRVAGDVNLGGETSEACAVATCRSHQRIQKEHRPNGSICSDATHQANICSYVCLDQNPGRTWHCFQFGTPRTARESN